MSKFDWNGPFLRSKVHPVIVALLAAFDGQLFLWAQCAQEALVCGPGYWMQGLGNLVTEDVLLLGLPLLIVAVPAYFAAWLFPVMRSRRISYSITAFVVLGLFVTAIVFPHIIPEHWNPRRCYSDG